MTTASPSPGWYTDPADSRCLRYWNGSAWTSACRPLPASDPASPRPQPNLLRIVTAWFDTGTAVVRFMKAALSLLAFLGLITVGGVGISTAVSSGGTHGGQSPQGVGPDHEGQPIVSNGSGRQTVSSALLRPCDLGDCDDQSGWVQTQGPPPGTTPCPAFPRTKPHAFIALVNQTTQVKVYEEIWSVPNAKQAVSTFARTAQNCSFTNRLNTHLTYQADDEAVSYGDHGRFFNIFTSSQILGNESPTLWAYAASFAHGTLTAVVYVEAGTEGTISQSMLSEVFTAVTHRLA